MFFYRIYKIIYDAGDKLEDYVRGYLSHFPIIYAFIGGVGIVLFWRGVWLTMDVIMERAVLGSQAITAIGMNLGAWWDGPLSLIIASALLLMTGVFVSNFIGNEILISGLKGEKKIAEKTEKEVRTEEERLAAVREQVSSMHSQMTALKKELDEVLEKTKNN